MNLNNFSNKKFSCLDIWELLCFLESLQKRQNFSEPGAESSECLVFIIDTVLSGVFQHDFDSFRDQSIHNLSSDKSLINIVVWSLFQSSQHDTERNQKLFSLYNDSEFDISVTEVMESISNAVAVFPHTAGLHTETRHLVSPVQEAAPSERDWVVSFLND